MAVSPIIKKTWDEFQATGLLFFINQVLHAFGWCIVVERDGDKIVSAYPARTTWRGFDPEDVDEGYTKINTYLKQYAEEPKF